MFLLFFGDPLAGEQWKMGNGGGTNQDTSRPDSLMMFGNYMTGYQSINQKYTSVAGKGGELFQCIG